MNEDVYLIVGPNGLKGTRKTRPSLKWNEISIKVNLNIPNAMFKRPHVEANIVVKEEALSPIEIKPEILINTKELIEQQSGMKVDFNILHQQIEKEEEKIPPKVEEGSEGIIDNHYGSDSDSNILPKEYY